LGNRQEKETQAGFGNRLDTETGRVGDSQLGKQAGKGNSQDRTAGRITGNIRKQIR
jgi:hypothetical protein